MSQPICPKCSATLKDDYGMVACPSCGSFVFVDMEGIAHISREEEAPAAAPEPEPYSAPEVSGDANPDLFQVQEFSAEVTNVQDPPPIVNLPALEMAEANERVEPSPFETQAVELAPEAEHVESYEPPPPPSEEVPPEGELDMDRLLGFNEPAAEEPAPEAEFGTPGDPLGINEYANSEISQAKDGLLTFKILISGIDSKEMRESLRSALDDQRFGWNAGDLMSRISKGVLQIDNVASVKAVILINRIKRMPVKVRWEQYAITNMDADSP